jgi:hypothetical protein
VAGHAMLDRIIASMLLAREALRSESGTLHRELLAIVRADAVCRRLMTVPGVGAVVAVTRTGAECALDWHALPRGGVRAVAMGCGGTCGLSASCGIRLPPSAAWRARGRPRAARGRPMPWRR